MQGRQLGDSQVAAIRSFSRFYTRKLGIIEPKLLDSPWTLQEARIIYEIAHRPADEAEGELGVQKGNQSHGGEMREGMAIVEGFRGDVLVWLRLRNGLIERCHMRDPSWFQWPLLEAVIENNIVADFPLCNKSFNCSYSGHDL